MNRTDTIIIGAGLTGLYLGYRLVEAGQEVLILDARSRVGGRILTDNAPGQAPVELGATWLGKKHTALVGLLEKLDLPIFEQRLGRRAIYEYMSTSPPQLVQLPPNEEPSFRIAGGTSALIRALSERLGPNHIRLGQKVQRVERGQGEVTVHTTDQVFSARRVISTLPPNLLLRSVTFSPALPEELTAVARQTHTWMGESIKVALRYRQAFWRSPDSSGTIFSNVGPLSEMYDHADVADSTYALKGFFNPAFFHVEPEERKNRLLNQLRKYYGDQIQEYTGYLEYVWRQDPLTFADYDQPVLPHQHNGHPVFRQAFWGGQLFVAGSETAEAFPGYMDGAVRSAEWVMEMVG